MTGSLFVTLVSLVVYAFEIVETQNITLKATIGEKLTRFSRDSLRDKPTKPYTRVRCTTNIY